MAEYYSNTTSVRKSTVRGSVNENDTNETISKYNGKRIDSTSEVTDDEYAESIVTIGEVDVDDYFDDVFNKTRRAASLDSSSSIEQSIHSIDGEPPEPIHPIQLSVDSVIPNIVEEKSSIYDQQRAATIEASSLINSYLISGKRIRNNYRQTISDSCYEGLTLNDIGVTVLSRFSNILDMDEHMMSTNRYLLRTPAYYSVYNILCSFMVKKRIDLDSFAIVLEAFNTIFPLWCLHRIEKLQFENLKERYPNTQISEFYGVIHFIRFATYIPYLLRAMGPFANKFNKIFVDFLNRFISFLEEAPIRIDLDDFDHVMPDYYRMTFKSSPSIIPHKY